MNDRAFMTHKEIAAAVAADRDFEHRINERAESLANDTKSALGIVDDNSEAFRKIYAKASDPEVDIYDINRELFALIQRFARERAELQVRPSDMDGFVEPLEYGYHEP